MDLVSQDLQYMVREPIDPHPLQKGLQHGSVPFGHNLKVTWGCRQGKVYLDGSHLQQEVHLGSTVQVAGDAPPLQVFPPEHAR